MYSKCPINASGYGGVTVLEEESHMSLSLFLPFSRVNSGKQGTLILFCAQHNALYLWGIQKRRLVMKGWDWELGNLLSGPSSVTLGWVPICSLGLRFLSWEMKAGTGTSISQGLP